jgi:tRNA(fMet)-specific endonuclease VapC
MPVKYLLDTNACIALMNGEPASVRTQPQEATRNGAEIFASSIAAFELWYDVAKSVRREFTRQRVDAFFSGPVQPLAFDNRDAEVAGTIRANLESVGKPMGAYDLQQSIHLATSSVTEFSRIKSLVWANWAKP